MSIAFVVLKLEGGGQIDPSQGVTGSRNSQGGIGLIPSLVGVKNTKCFEKFALMVSIIMQEKNIIFIIVIYLKM